jgi:hypothetical protein
MYITICRSKTVKTVHRESHIVIDKLKINTEIHLNDLVNNPKELGRRKQK